MELQHTFTIPVPPDEAFEILRDIRRIAPCLPGATVDDVDGDAFTGKIRMRIGPMQVTYRGDAAYADVDPDARRATLVARGKEARGTGTAHVTVRAELHDRGAETEVALRTEVTVTGRPSQLGGGVLADSSDRLITRFAQCLAEEVGGSTAGASAAAAALVPAVPPSSDEEAGAGARLLEPTAPTGAVASSGPPATRPRDDATGVPAGAGAPLVRRAAPTAAAVALLVLLVWLVRRLRAT